MSVDDTDYDDIYDNSNDYDYHYNHVNRSNINAFIIMYAHTCFARDK